MYSQFMVVLIYQLTLLRKDDREPRGDLRTFKRAILFLKISYKELQQLSFAPIERTNEKK